MLDTKKMVSAFSNLSFEDKRKKLLWLYEQVKDASSMFSDVYALLSADDMVSDDLMLFAYTILVDTVHQVRNLKNESLHKEYLERMSQIARIVVTDADAGASTDQELEAMLNTI